jgi:DNA-binding transcriptional MerR regulator
MVTNAVVLSHEAGKILDVTPSTVRSLESRGVLKATRTPNGTRVFDRADVERLARMRANRVKGQSR